ncbi:MAG: MinD/ParA family protein [Eubacterium sp.]|nr:MinD/ParA family protein [Eubacterium sp.]
MDQAEGLRNMLRAKRQQSRPTSRVITVTSGKGGVGKSSVSVNLAVQLARLGKRVIIFDADFGLANIEVMFGKIPQYTLNDVIYKGKRISEIVTEGPMGIGFISGGSGIVGLNNLTDGQRAYLLSNMAELDNMADIIIVDTGAGVSDTVLDFVKCSNEIIMVTTSEPSSLTDAYSVLKALMQDNTFDRNSKISVITNKVKHMEEGKAIYDKLNSVSNQFLGKGLEFMGIVPQDSYLEKAVRKQKPVSILYPESKASAALERMARGLVNLPQDSYGVKGFSQFISGLLLRR